MFDCGRFHLTAWRDHAFVLPPLLSRGLALVPGDILLIERSSEHSLFLRIFRELLAFHQGIIDPQSRWLGFLENLKGIPTVIDASRRLVIPPEALAVEEGETLTLRVYSELEGVQDTLRDVDSERTLIWLRQFFGRRHRAGRILELAGTGLLEGDLSEMRRRWTRGVNGFLPFGLASAKGGPPSGAHSDIVHPETAWAALAAAGIG